jgi:hypothetical protein
MRCDSAEIPFSQTDYDRVWTPVSGAHIGPGVEVIGCHAKETPPCASRVHLDQFERDGNFR